MSKRTIICTVFAIAIVMIATQANAVTCCPPKTFNIPGTNWCVPYPGSVNIYVWGAGFNPDDINNSQFFVTVGPGSDHYAFSAMDGIAICWNTGKKEGPNHGTAETTSTASSTSSSGFTLIDSQGRAFSDEIVVQIPDPSLDYLCPSGQLAKDFVPFHFWMQIQVRRDTDGDGYYESVVAEKNAACWAPDPDSIGYVKKGPDKGVVGDAYECFRCQQGDCSDCFDNADYPEPTGNCPEFP